MHSTLPCAHEQLYSTVYACAVLYIVRMRSCFLQCVHAQLYYTLCACAAAFYSVCIRSCTLHCTLAQLYPTLCACAAVLYFVCMRSCTYSILCTCECSYSIYSILYIVRLRSCTLQYAHAQLILCTHAHCPGHTLSPETQKKFSTAGRMGVAVRVASTIEDLPDKVRTICTVCTDKLGTCRTTFRTRMGSHVHCTIFFTRLGFQRQSSVQGKNL